MNNLPTIFKEMARQHPKLSRKGTMEQTLITQL